MVSKAALSRVVDIVWYAWHLQNGTAVANIVYSTGVECGFRPNCQQNSPDCRSICPVKWIWIRYYGGMIHHTAVWCCLQVNGTSYVVYVYVCWTCSLLYIIELSVFRYSCSQSAGDLPPWLHYCCTAIPFFGGGCVLFTWYTYHTISYYSSTAVCHIRSTCNSSKTYHLQSTAVLLYRHCRHACVMSHIICI